MVLPGPHFAFDLVCGGHGQDLNPARPGKEKSGRYSLITGPAGL